jgi:hypothetical protein
MRKNPGPQPIQKCLLNNSNQATSTYEIPEIESMDDEKTILCATSWWHYINDCYKEKTTPKKLGVFTPKHQWRQNDLSTVFSKLLQI